jgi:hypothetical protein
MTIKGHSVNTLKEHVDLISFVGVITTSDIDDDGVADAADAADAVGEDAVDADAVDEDAAGEVEDVVEVDSFAAILVAVVEEVMPPAGVLPSKDVAPTISAPE